ncbi:MAG: ATP phosphoribosyltransferase regulatory subunit [Pseudomonadota bacterium]
MTEPDVLEASALAEIKGMLVTLSTLFTDAGFEPLQPAHLFPAETLLDLYGEDIRARAFLFPDPVQGDEMCLRPDFTVPVAMAHGKRGWDQMGRYCYHGPVFRQQEAGISRPVEYLQAGIEDFGELDQAAADCRIFQIIHHGLDALAAPPSRTTIGDLGIVFALLDTMEMPEGRRQQLRRHIWRPARFHALLDHFGRAGPEPTPRRAAVLAAASEGRLEAVLAEAGEPIGLRSPVSIRDRAAALLAASKDPVMPSDSVRLIEAVLDLECPADQAPARLSDVLEAGGIRLDAAIETLSRRLDALSSAGFDLSSLIFDADFGRNLEYYDGFVFEVTVENWSEGPPIAGGGRYDTITARLGAEAPRPAVGGIIRPEALREARGQWR